MVRVRRNEKTSSQAGTQQFAYGMPCGVSRVRVNMPAVGEVFVLHLSCNINSARHLDAQLQLNLNRAGVHNENRCSKKSEITRRIFKVFL
jgi:hypothetical protein